MRRRDLIGALLAPRREFPGSEWQTREPARAGADATTLDQLAEALGGHGCVVKDGYVVKAWGDQAERRDWLSSAKPVLSTMLFMAIQQGKVKSVDQPLADFGWPLREKDRTMTFRHLGAMTSGYARPEAPGAAFAYNDYAIQFYQKTLFDKVFQGEPEASANGVFQALGLQDGIKLNPRNRRLSASVRDFARISWFWLNDGKWHGKQVLAKRFFTEYRQPQVPSELPHTAPAKDDDYLGIGTFGGGSDHFTKFGAGIYGFNWWFNRTGRLHPNAITWPDAPRDTYLSIGAGGNYSAMIPSLGVILASSRGKWGQVAPGDPNAAANQHLKLLTAAFRKKR